MTSNVFLPWLTSLPGDGNSSVMTRAVTGHSWNHLYVWVTLASGAMVLIIAFTFRQTLVKHLRRFSNHYLSLTDYNICAVHHRDCLGDPECLIPCNLHVITQ